MRPLCRITAAFGLTLEVGAASGTRHTFRDRAWTFLSLSSTNRGLGYA
jgi:hypothetical protein